VSQSNLSPEVESMLYRAIGAMSIAQERFKRLSEDRVKAARQIEKFDHMLESVIEDMRLAIENMKPSEPSENATTKE